MGYETPLGQSQGYGGEMGTSPEAVPSYAELGHSELIDRFYETEGDPAIGTELSVRLLAHAGIPVDPRTAPLIGRDGTQVQLDGKPLTLADYVNFAASDPNSDHFAALPEILDFLLQRPGEPKYKMTQAGMVARLNPTGR